MCLNISEMFKKNQLQDEVGLQHYTHSVMADRKTPSESSRPRPLTSQLTFPPSKHDPHKVNIRSCADRWTLWLDTPPAAVLHHQSHEGQQIHLWCKAVNKAALLPSQRCSSVCFGVSSQLSCILKKKGWWGWRPATGFSFLQLLVRTSG